MEKTCFNIASVYFMFSFRTGDVQDAYKLHICVPHNNIYSGSEKYFEKIVCYLNFDVRCEKN